MTHFSQTVGKALQDVPSGQKVFSLVIFISYFADKLCDRTGFTDDACVKESEKL
jgi:hypothetical protein